MSFAESRSAATPAPAPAGSSGASRHPGPAWSYPRKQYPAQQSLAQLFREAAHAHAERTALSASGRLVTYRELLQHANALAAHLRARGVERDTLVAIVADRTPEMIVAVLGTVLAGGAYVPIDPDYPVERIRFIIEDTRTPVIVAQPHLLQVLPPASAKVVTLNPLPAAPPAVPELPIEARPDDLAYVMYTSGSTGAPKGAMIPHRAVTRLVRGQDYISFGPDEIFLQAAPISFDASTLEIWGPLLNGGRLALLPPGKFSLAQLGRVICEERVSTLWLTAGLFQVMVEEQLDSLRPIRQLLTGGDVLPVEQVRKVVEQLPDTTLVNGYGPTENTTFTCCHRVTRQDGSRSNIPIGKPIFNTSVHILDSDLRPVPIGDEGELFTGGAGLALGYLNRPELTAERFLRSPFVPDELLYRTGDVARWLPDGTIEFVGRKDEQVKLRGYRVELGEIESVLARHPAVKAVCVSVQDEGKVERRLVAHVIARGTEVPVADLKLHLASKLPEYMVPAAFVWVDAFPLTPNGKIDRRALPQPTRTTASPFPRHDSSDLETSILHVWRELLGIETIELDDNFFDLGGNSLLVAQVHARLQKLLQREFPITDLFTHATVRSSAAHFRGVTTTPANADAQKARAQRQRDALAARRAPGTRS